MEEIKFGKNKFPVVKVHLPFGESFVSILRLNRALMNMEGNYVSEEARLIDEKIFYFVEENQLKMSETKLVDLILSEI
ncbi:hypothetical protein ERX46_16760 [Brumimicrobium glaciale]|uniref:Uncharacterized protein n=1 Tax=Brumimicrobium glaciale TaxID=200475 RepID=A0A4Q4KE59_9FLAO|nr:hypothetical protein [Brumimicrobium glaciale]RYM31333.1 hypothetical protein ERX46_16760 [Brumimicrobium glaciale]